MVPQSCSALRVEGGPTFIPAFNHQSLVMGHLEGWGWCVTSQASLGMAAPTPSLSFPAAGVGCTHPLKWEHHCRGKGFWGQEIKIKPGDQD